MPKINVRLSTSSIDKAIKQIEEYRRKVEDLPDNVVKTLTEDGVDFAQEIALGYDAYDSGELVNGIVAEYREDKGYVHSTAPHSAFVEMGTGVVGKNNPNPNDTYPGWVYDVNEHGEAGWKYIGKDGKWHWTKGMPSRPFMYDTAQTLKSEVADVVRKELE